MVVTLPPSRVVPAASVQEYVASALPEESKGSEVDCGATYLVVEDGDDVTCTLALGAKERKVDLSVAEDGTLTLAP